MDAALPFFDENPGLLERVTRIGQGAPIVDMRLSESEALALAGSPVVAKLWRISSSAKPIGPASKVRSILPTARVMSAAESSIRAKASQGDLVHVRVTFASDDWMHERRSAEQEALSMHKRDVVRSRLMDRLREHASRGAFRLHRQFKYQPVFSAYVDAHALDALLHDPLVMAVEEPRLAAPALYSVMDHVRADDLWTLGFDGDGYAVAVLDTGIAGTHDMYPSGKIVAEACFSTDNVIADSLCPNGSTSQTGTGAAANCPTSGGGAVEGCGHGDSTAGTAAGSEDTYGGQTVSGAAKGAKIVAIQVFSKITDAGVCEESDYSAPCALSYAEDQELAWEWLRDNYSSISASAPIKAINMSIAGGRYNEECGKNVDLSWLHKEKRVVIVAASGNRGYGQGGLSGTPGVGHPACLKHVLAVGATDEGFPNALWSSTNIGAPLDLLAPGYAVHVPEASGGFFLASGTSLAAPIVAGASLLLREAFPNIAVGVLDSVLATEGTSVSGTSAKRLNVYDSYQNLDGGSPGAPSAPTLSSAPLHCQGKTELTWTPPGVGEVDDFYVESSFNSTFTNIDQTFYTSELDAFVDSTATAWWRVKACNSAGCSGASNSRKVTYYEECL